MKRIAFRDAWRNLEKTDCSVGLKALAISQLDGVHDFSEEISGSINAICGFNGAGKTTILQCIHNAFDGPQESVSDRILRASVSATFLSKGNSVVIQKAAAQAFPNVAQDRGELIAIDTGTQVPLLQSFFRTTPNLDEELKQHESISLEAGQIELLSYLVGRDYEEVTVIELSDDYADGGTDSNPASRLAANDCLTYFKVKVNGIEYAVENMGLGELALIHIFWLLETSKKKSLVLIEEPESFVASASQLALIDVVAHYATKKNLWVCISTHSEHILSKIPEKNILALTREATGKHTVRRNVRRDEHLSQLRLAPRPVGYMFCEDWVGILFAKRLLELMGSSIVANYQFLPLFGDAKIEKMLQTYPKGRTVVPVCGIFDGDVRAKVEAGSFPKNPIWPSVLLPGSVPPEQILLEVARSNLEKADQGLGLSAGTTSRVLGTLEGLDIHDRLTDFSLRIDRAISWVIAVLTAIWYESDENKKLAGKFVDELTAICDSWNE